MQYKNLKNIKAENQRKRQSERLKNGSSGIWSDKYIKYEKKPL